MEGKKERRGGLVGVAGGRCGQMKKDCGLASEGSEGSGGNVINNPKHPLEVKVICLTTERS